MNSLLLICLINIQANMTAPKDTSTDLFNFDKLWDYRDPAMTESRFRELLPKAEAAADQSIYIQLMTQIARTQGLQMKFDEGHATLDRVENLLESEPAVEHIRFALERGRLYNSKGDKEKAVKTFKDAIGPAEAVGNDYYTVDLYHMLGICSPVGEQLQWNEKAVKLAENSGNQRAKRWLGALYNNVGWTYFDMADYQSALETFRKTLEYYSGKEEMKNNAFIAEWSIAKTLRILGQKEEALEMQQLLKKKREAAGIPESGYVSEEIGECLLALDRAAEAATHFKTAFDMLSEDKWLQQNEAERLTRLKDLSGQ